MIVNKLDYGGRELFIYYNDAIKDFRKIKNIFEIMDYKRAEDKVSLMGKSSKCSVKERLRKKKLQFKKKFISMDKLSLRQGL